MNLLRERERDFSVDGVNVDIGHNVSENSLMVSVNCTEKALREESLGVMKQEPRGSPCTCTERTVNEVIGTKVNRKSSVSLFAERRVTCEPDSCANFTLKHVLW